MSRKGTTKTAPEPTVEAQVSPTTGTSTLESGGAATGAQAESAPKNWGPPYKAVFTSTIKGFEMGEDRRFKQVVFKFADKPSQTILDRLKEAGFTYRPAEKAWTVPATAATREWASNLAHELAGESQVHER